MSKVFLMLILSFLIINFSFIQFSCALDPGEISENDISIKFRNITVYAPAVAQISSGYMGVISTITFTIQDNGSGRVFVDTLPLTQIDMQGSARLAVKVASALVKNDHSNNIDPSSYDYFFVIRTNSPIIGGPSAGAIMTTAVISLLQNWTMDDKTVMTGMINPDGSIGPVGGIIQKIDAAYYVGATRFLIPKGQGEYTETITETVTDNGWTQIITRNILRNVSDYALENYNIEVIEVEDINDVLLYYTGWNFPVVESNYSITTEDYIESMKPLAMTLLNNSRNSFDNATESFNKAQIPNKFPYYYKNQVTDFLNNAEETLIESEEWFNQELYYTSTSKSFQSLINSNFVIFSSEYFNSEDGDKYVDTLISKAEEINRNKSIIAKNAEVNGIISLQCVGAAQKRSSDAESYLLNAKSSYQNGDYLTAIYNIAYAMQRSNSIEWWIGISSFFNDTGDITNTILNNLAREYIDDAQQSLVYSNVILQEVGQTSSYLNEAEELLETARMDNEKGYPAAALFEAIESLANSNLALELIEGINEDKLDRYREGSSSSISESRLRGIEPVLAVSYYEYAQSLVNESLIDSAVFYYKYSDLITGVLSLTSTTDGLSSRYIGIPEIKVNLWNRGLLRYKELIILFVIIGGITGLSIGIILGKKASNNSNKWIQEEWIPKSIKDYYNGKQKDVYFTEDNIPRSIKDYYRKINK